MAEKKPIVFQFQPHDAPITPEQAKQEDEETVLMMFPHRVLLTLDSRQVVAFPAGPQEVPAHLVEHPYLKAHKVQRYTKSVPVVAKVPELTEDHLPFIHDRGYSVKSVADANKFFQNMSPEQRTTFMFDYAEWTKGQVARPKMTLGSTASEIIADASAGMPSVPKQEPVAQEDEADGDEEEESAEEQAQSGQDPTAVPRRGRRGKNKNQQQGSDEQKAS